FFIFPVFCFFLARAGTHRLRARLFMAAGLVGLVTLLLPFVIPGASLPRYIDLLALARHQGFSRWVFEKNVVYLLMFWSPVAWLWAMFRPRLPAGLWWFGAASLPSMGMVILAASLPGGGPYNFLAFLPSLTWLLVHVMRAVHEQTQDATQTRRLDLSRV